MQFRLFQAGAQVGGAIAATYVGTGTYAYFADIPNTVPAGPVAFALYRADNGRLRSAGDVYWNGSDIVVPEALLTFIRDVAEADENYTPTKAQKLLKGTTTVLVDKDVTSTTTCEVDTQLTEAP